MAAEPRSFARAADLRKRGTSDADVYDFIAWRRTGMRELGTSHIHSRTGTHTSRHTW
jgi:hypothetical protein